jgi:hypothetical protein
MEIIKSIKEALWKAFLATLLFLLVYLFYNSEVVRANTEDIAFDVINKFYIHTSSEHIDSPHLLLFAIDDLYMKEQRLYDGDGTANYGYLLPRDHIAKFIKRVDILTSEMDPANLPKALFIDYDLSFTMLPYGKEPSREDRQLLDTLKKRRPYTILLPKTDKYNFVQQSKDPDIQKAIKEKKIIFVSVPLLQSSDDIVRRYQSYQEIGEINGSETYIGVVPALWQTLRERPVDLNSSKKRFMKNDIVGNRIWIKAYRPAEKEEACIIQQSYWDILTKYSANCSLFEIVEEDFAKSVLLLGGTHTHNDDRFDVLSVGSATSLSGIDMQANALMTALTLNGSLERLPLWISLLLIFFTFLMIDVLLSSLFIFLKIENGKIQFIVLLVINTTILIILSIYILKHYYMWFNWFVPLLLLQMIEVIEIIQKQIPKIKDKLRRKK